jgi:hypothetical protein
VCGQMCGLGKQLKVLDTVIKGVVIDVVNDHSRRDWPIASFPHQSSTKHPRIGVRDFNPDSLSIAALMSGANPFGPNGEAVVRRNSWNKLPAFVSHRTLLGHHYNA